MPSLITDEQYYGMLALVDGPWLKGRQFAEEYRFAWRKALRRAKEREESFLPADPTNIFVVPHSFQGLEIDLHFNLEKIDDWFRQDDKGKERRVFLPHDLKRTIDRTVGIEDSRLEYHPKIIEQELPNLKRELVICSLPGVPPPLRMIYGNSWAEECYHGFRKRFLPVNLIAAEFTPAFLSSPMEMCAYLLFMDCCILDTNRSKLKDDKIKSLLHVFRSSSVLTLQGLIEQK